MITANLMVVMGKKLQHGIGHRHDDVNGNRIHSDGIRNDVHGNKLHVLYNRIFNIVNGEDDEDQRRGEQRVPHDNVRDCRFELEEIQKDPLLIEGLKAVKNEFNYTLFEKVVHCDCTRIAKMLIEERCVNLETTYLYNTEEMHNLLISYNLKCSEYRGL